MASLTDLIHRVTASCLLHHHAAPEEQQLASPSGDQAEVEEAVSYELFNAAAEDKSVEKMREMEGMMAEVFDAVSALKRAYVSLQQSHSPWDPVKMRSADAAVVAELKRLGRARDRYRRRGAAVAAPVAPLSEAVAPYEAAMEDLRREVKAKEAEVEMLKEKLRNTTARGKNRSGVLYGRRVGLPATPASPATPTPELFISCMDQVKSSTKSFTSHLLSLMRTANVDMATTINSLTASTAIHLRHAKHALESYITRRLFLGFENETFYISGSLTSLLHPAEFRLDCFTQFRDMRNMDPVELLGVLPSCPFGLFAAKKYLSVVGMRMEEALFGNSEQRRRVEEGGHPRTGFYGEFLNTAKAVWMLHLLAFAFEPVVSLFRASVGAGLDPVWMENVVRSAGGAGSEVGFEVSPGFKTGSGSVLVRARVYLVG